MNKKDFTYFVWNDFSLVVLKIWSFHLTLTLFQLHLHFFFQTLSSTFIMSPNNTMDENRTDELIKKVVFFSTTFGHMPTHTHAKLKLKKINKKSNVLM